MPIKRRKGYRKVGKTIDVNFLEVKSTGDIKSSVKSLSLCVSGSKDCYTIQNGEAKIPVGFPSTLLNLIAWNRETWVHKVYPTARSSQLLRECILQSLLLSLLLWTRPEPRFSLESQLRRKAGLTVTCFWMSTCLVVKSSGFSDGKQNQNQIQNQGGCHHIFKPSGKLLSPNSTPFSRPQEIQCINYCWLTK